MKGELVVLSLGVLLLNGCFNQTRESTDHAEPQPDSVSLSISLEPGQRVSFNVFDVYGRSIEFKNNDTADAVIEKRFFIDKPLFLANGNLIVIPDGEPLFRTYGVLLNPGDSVLLRKADTALIMQYSTGFPNFIDSMLTIPKAFYWGTEKHGNLGTSGVSRVLQTIEATYDKNNAAIGTLRMPVEHMRVLKNFNTNIKYAATARLIGQPTVEMSSLTDSLYDDMFRHVDAIRSINAVNNGLILAAIVSYTARKQNRKLEDDDFRSYVATMDEPLKQSGIYHQRVVSRVVGSFVHTPEKLAEINQALQSMRTQDPFLDTMYQLSNILLETSANFKKAEKDLNEFADGRFRFIFEHLGTSANREIKRIANLPVIEMYDFKGAKSDFRRIVMDKKYKLTVVDLWASWCIPCIGEMPHWEKVKAKFLDKPVRFMTVSIDKEEDVSKWIAVAKREGIYDKPDQYRLAKFRTSPFTKLLNVREIPRYLVINNEGDVVDDNFRRPSDRDFELALLRLLN